MRKQRPEPLVTFIGPVPAAFRKIRANVLPDACAEHVIDGVFMPVRQAQLVRRPPDRGDDRVVGLHQRPPDVGDNEVYLPAIRSQCNVLQKSRHGQKPHPANPANKSVNL